MDYEAQYLKQRLDTENGRFASNPLAGEAKGVYLDKVSQNYKDEAEACLKKEFVEWLQGNHEANVYGALGTPYIKGVNVPMTAPNRRHVYDGEVSTPKDDWVPTDWGRAQLTHLPGVRDWLRSQREHSDRAELDMNLLAEHGPQNLEEAWMYFKHWVKHRPVDVDECVKQEYTDFDKNRFIRAPGGPMLPTYNRTNMAPLIDRGDDGNEFDIFNGDDASYDTPPRVNTPAVPTGPPAQFGAPVSPAMFSLINSLSMAGASRFSTQQGNGNGVGAQQPTPMTAAVGSQASTTKQDASTEIDPSTTQDASTEVDPTNTQDASTVVDLTTAEALATQAALRTELARLEAENITSGIDASARESYLRSELEKLGTELRAAKGATSMLRGEVELSREEGAVKEAILRSELGRLDADTGYLNNLAAQNNVTSSAREAILRTEVARLEAEKALGMTQASDSSEREARLRTELMIAKGRLDAHEQDVKEALVRESVLSEELSLVEGGNEKEVLDLSSVLKTQLQENERIQTELTALAMQLSEVEAEGAAESTAFTAELQQLEVELKRARDETQRIRASAGDLIEKVQTFDAAQMQSVSLKESKRNSELIDRLQILDATVRLLERELQERERELSARKNEQAGKQRVSMTGDRLTSQRAAARPQAGDR